MGDRVEQIGQPQQQTELEDDSERRSRRLAAEYLETERALERSGIRNTVVVFGSTRLLDPEVARRRLKLTRERLGEAPSGPEAVAALGQAERELERSRYYEVAREFGRIVGRHGTGESGGRLAIVTGGGPGAMEAANRGASDVSAASVGLNISLPHEQSPNAFVSPGLSFSFRYFALRKLHFMLRARALVVFPGGYGTLDELFGTLCLVQTGKRPPLPVVLIGSSFWRTAIDFDFLLAEGVIDERSRQLFTIADTAEESWQAIVSWYAERKLPFLA